VSKGRPNILLITSDQQHWTTLGIYNREIKTPNLDRLAAQGTVFDRAYTTNPTCTPARASVITGKYPSQHGAWSLGTKLPESEHTVGEDFTGAGYRTALVGKAHFQPLATTDEYPSIESQPHCKDLDFWRGFHGPFYGFQHVELARNHNAEQHVGQHYALWMEEKGLRNWRDYYPPAFPRKWGEIQKWKLPEQFHNTTWIAERSIALMREYNQRGEPFFLWASFFDPHYPFNVPEPWDTMYDPAKLTLPAMVEGEHDDNPPHFRLTQVAKPDYSAWQEPGGHNCHGFKSHLPERARQPRDVAIRYGMISMMDKYIGRILDKLDELGIADTTLVVFTTDHGDFFGQHGLFHKGAFHYEDMIRIPFIVRLPGEVPAGARSQALQSLADLAPTFLSVAGLPSPRAMTGVDQKDVWFGRRPHARDHVIVENHHQPTTLHLKTCVDDRYKITVYYRRDYGEMFDLREDPNETNNLWAKPEFAALKAELAMKLLQAEMGKEPMWMPRLSGA